MYRFLKKHGFSLLIAIALVSIILSLNIDTSDYFDPKYRLGEPNWDSSRKAPKKSKKTIKRDSILYEINKKRYRSR